MTTTSPISSSGEDRRHRRSKLFVGVTVFANSKSSPARLRDISPSGALLEMRAPPKVGTKLKIKRGTLEREAAVRWARDSRCGVKFDEEVIVLDWISGQVDQPSIDRMMNNIRTGIAAEPEEPMFISSSAELAEVLSERLAEEIDFATRTIDDLCSALTKDSHLIKTQSNNLQRMDAVTQSLTQLANILRSTDQLSAISNCPLGNLKARLLRT